MSSFAEFCTMTLIILAFTEIYVAINDLSLTKTLASFPIGFLGNIAMNGVLLAMNEYLFIKYLKKVVFKKQLAFNHDFVGLWLEITNVVLAFCLAVLHIHGANFAKNSNPFYQYLESLPSIRYK